VSGNKRERVYEGGRKEQSEGSRKGKSSVDKVSKSRIICDQLSLF
jgi:hypothetical protein